MTIESVSIDSLTEDPANARVHSKKNLQAIKASLVRFGQQKPIVVDGKNIVRAGNGTLNAARALGWKEIQIVRTDLFGSEAAGYAIADNRATDMSEWDDDALGRQLESLRDEGVKLTDLGFAERDLKKLLDETETLNDNEELLGKDQWLVLVTCADEADQAKFLEQMDRENRLYKALLG